MNCECVTITTGWQLRRQGKFCTLDPTERQELLMGVTSDSRHSCSKQKGVESGKPLVGAKSVYSRFHPCYCTASEVPLPEGSLHSLVLVKLPGCWSEIINLSAFCYAWDISFYWQLRVQFIGCWASHTHTHTHTCTQRKPTFN